MKKITKLINKNFKRHFKVYKHRLREKDRNNEANTLHFIDVKLAKLFNNINDYIINEYYNGNEKFLIIFSKEAKNILKYKNIIKKYNLRKIYCSNYSCYQLEYFHKHCSGRHFDEYKIAGCFDCLEIFNSELLKNEECQPNDYLVTCPYCGIDSILYESDKFPLTKDFLFWMELYWFGSYINDEKLIDHLNIENPLKDDYSVYEIYNGVGNHILDIDKYKNALNNCINFKNDETISKELSYNRKEILDHFYNVYGKEKYSVNRIRIKDYTKIDLFHYKFFKDINNDLMIELRNIFIDHLKKNKSFQFEYDGCKFLFFREDEFNIIGLGENDYPYYIRTLNQFIELNGFEK